MQEAIRKLLNEKNAILLAHNYQPPAIQDIADMCGDSLELSIRAANTNAAIIVFCGVRFMAETAAILSPQKSVLLPRADAGCPMADMVTAKDLAAHKKQLPDVPVVTYVNSTAAVKALSDICCTSANAVEIVSDLKQTAVLMVPDRNLARYTAAQTKKTVHLWEGWCPYHDLLTPADVAQARAAHPDAVFMAHPECPLEILSEADVVASTSGMLKFAKKASATEFIVGTEIGLLYPLQRENPHKRFFPASEKMLCADMKKIELGDILHSLTTLEGRVQVPETVRKPAMRAVQRMIDLSTGAG